MVRVVSVTTSTNVAMDDAMRAVDPPTITSHLPPDATTLPSSLVPDYPSPGQRLSHARVAGGTAPIPGGANVSRLVRRLSTYVPHSRGSRTGCCSPMLFSFDIECGYLQRPRRAEVAQDASEARIGLSASPSAATACPSMWPELKMSSIRSFGTAWAKRKPCARWHSASCIACS
jgi:hypothetical protein